MYLKLDWVLTLFPGFLPSVSEVGPGSDPRTWICTFCVRSWPGFGPKNLDLYFLCPKLARVRTQEPGLVLFVSEVALFTLIAAILLLREKIFFISIIGGIIIIIGVILVNGQLKYFSWKKR